MAVRCVTVIYKSVSLRSTEDKHTRKLNMLDKKRKCW